MKQHIDDNLVQPAWTPTPEFIATTNIAWLMRQAGVESYEKLHAWSVGAREAFWEIVIARLDIRFAKPYSSILEISGGIESPRWLPDAKLNIVESCFGAPADSPAIIHQAEGGGLKITTVGELEALTDRIAANLVRCGFRPGDSIAIILPMTAEAVAIYLGIVRAGCVVVGIADSFQPKEIAARLRSANAVAVFTQDLLSRSGKEYPLYGNITEAGAPTTFVLPAGDNLSVPLRAGDCDWRTFMQSDISCAAVSREPGDHINILFSSGTTAEPKAIPWTQTTPIKCAMDAHFHQNIMPGDVLVWPTNIGWMMGPWLIFAALLNRATLGLYCGAPTGREFGSFVQDAKTTLLGVVPSMVSAWRSSGCMKGLNWSAIKVFSSTGECSKADDMRWLMSLAGCRPIIEYCGGTEIGGGYITGTVTRPCVPGAFNTPALGLDFQILDENGAEADNGELFIVPPSIGLSTSLLNRSHNRSHYDVYYADTPRGPHGEILRRHGDQMERLPGGYWRGHGRADDTMNLSGIKISSAEIERVLQGIPNVLETSAVAVSPDGGPSKLVIYAVCSDAVGSDNGVPAASEPTKHEFSGQELVIAMQNAIKTDLNPLFRIHDLVLVDALPRTASNKVMRRLLRDRYVDGYEGPRQ